MAQFFVNISDFPLLGGEEGPVAGFRQQRHPQPLTLCAELKINSTRPSPRSLTEAAEPADRCGPRERMSSITETSYLLCFLFFFSFFPP